MRAVGAERSVMEKRMPLLPMSTRAWRVEGSWAREDMLASNRRWVLARVFFVPFRSWGLGVRSY